MAGGIWVTNKFGKERGWHKREDGRIKPRIKKCKKCKIRRVKYHHYYCNQCYKQMIIDRNKKLNKENNDDGTKRTGDGTREREQKTEKEKS